jgi:hypothetical protein
MAKQNIAAVWNTRDNFSPKVSKFLVEFTNKQLYTITQSINMEEAGWEILMTFLLLSKIKIPNIMIGKAYQALCQIKIPKI